MAGAMPQSIDAGSWLVKAGLRPTRQRVALARMLRSGGHRHLTAEALHEEAAAAGEKVSLATVYNALKCFTDAGLLREVHVEAGRVYYDTRLDDHAHFYYEEDGSIEDAPADAIALALPPAAPEGAEIAKIEIVLRLKRRP